MCFILFQLGKNEGIYKRVGLHEECDKEVWGTLRYIEPRRQIATESANLTIGVVLQIRK